MRCKVLNVAGDAVVVVTATGRHVAVTLEWDEKLERWYYPIRPGYASTVLKFAGSELDRLIVYFDVPYVPAAAYTAMSRVRLQQHIKVGGWITPDHFRPAL
eukprot:2032802-Karenia_brevis.AAC.2